MPNLKNKSIKINNKFDTKKLRYSTHITNKSDIHDGNKTVNPLKSVMSTLDQQNS